MSSSVKETPASVPLNPELSNTTLQYFLLLTAGWDP